MTGLGRKRTLGSMGSPRLVHFSTGTDTFAVLEIPFGEEVREAA
jgi:hypothetical protein